VFAYLSAPTSEPMDSVKKQKIADDLAPKEPVVMLYMIYGLSEEFMEDTVVVKVPLKRFKQDQLERFEKHAIMANEHYSKIATSMKLFENTPLTKEDRSDLESWVDKSGEGIGACTIAVDRTKEYVVQCVYI
jgi:hypothetical protein